MTDENEKNTIVLDELKALLYQYKKLFDRWSEDRQDFNRQGYDIEKLIKSFSEKIDQFAKLEPTVKQKIVASIQEATKESIQSVHSATRDEMSEAILPTLQRFEKTIQTANEQIEKYEKKSIKETVLSYGVAVIVGIACGLLVAQFMMPPPIYPIDDERLHYVLAGERLTQIWPKLTNAEKKRITTLFNTQEKKDHDVT
jgi:hypothetical protein